MKRSNRSKKLVLKHIKLGSKSYYSARLNNQKFKHKYMFLRFRIVMKYPNKVNLGYRSKSVDSVLSVRDKIQ